MLANIAHDMVVCVQQPMFTELFGASYRYSGAGVGYRWRAWSAAALPRLCRGAGHLLRRIVAQRGLYLTAGCLLSALTALMMKKHRRLTHQRRA